MKKLLVSVVAFMLIGCYNQSLITGIDWADDYTEDQLIKYELSVDDSIDTVIVEVTIVRSNDGMYYYSVDENNKLFEIYIDVNLSGKQEITVSIDSLVRYKGTYLEYGGLTDIYVDNIIIMEL